MLDKCNILFTSVGRRSYLVEYFKSEIGVNGEIHVMNSSKLSPVFNMADYSVVSPLIYSDEYIPFVLDYCNNKKIDLLISLFDIDLPILSRNKEKFLEVGTRVLVSDHDFIEVCNDKWKTYNFLIENGFNAPKTYLNVEEALSGLTKGDINYPLIIKPRWGMGSISVFEIENEDELNVLYNKVKRNINNTYLKYESDIDIDNSVLIQQKINGQEYGLDIINDLTGKYQTTIIKKKVAMRSGETDCAETLYDDEISQIGERIGKLTKHIANLDTDLFIDKNGKKYILEMNARFGGGYPFSHMAGANLPLAIIRWARGEEMPSNILQYKDNVICQKDIILTQL